MEISHEVVDTLNLMANKQAEGGGGHTRIDHQQREQHTFQVFEPDLAFWRDVISVHSEFRVHVRLSRDG